MTLRDRLGLPPARADNIPRPVVEIVGGNRSGKTDAGTPSEWVRRALERRLPPKEVR